MQIDMCPRCRLSWEGTCLLHKAAEELLKACKAQVAEWHSNRRNFKRAEPKSLKLARAAIAKVE